MIKHIMMMTMAVVVTGSTVACAHQPKAASDPKMERMAQMHTDMAACLRTDKAFDDCHGQMMASCQEDGVDGCPMYGLPKGPHMGRRSMGRMPPAPLPDARPESGTTEP